MSKEYARSSPSIADCTSLKSSTALGDNLLNILVMSSPFPSLNHQGGQKEEVKKDIYDIKHGYPEE